MRLARRPSCAAVRWGPHLRFSLFQRLNSSMSGTSNYYATKMREEGQYERHSLAAMRPLSSISEISQPEQQDSESTTRESVSPIISPAIFDNYTSHHPPNEKDRLQNSSRSVTSSRTATSSFGTLLPNDRISLLIVVH